MDKDYNEIDQDMTNINENKTEENSQAEENSQTEDLGKEQSQNYGQNTNYQNQQGNYGFYNNQNNQNYNQYNNPYGQNFTTPNMDGGQGPKNPKKKGTGRKVLYVCGALVLGAVIGLSSFATLRVLNRNDRTPQIESGTSAQNNEAEEEQQGSSSDIKIGSTEPVTGANDNEVSKVVENTLPSIVMINCSVKTSQYGKAAEGVASGSGIIIKEDSKNLYIVTNHHVVANAEKVSVVFSDEASVEATVKAFDSTNDLAILKISLGKIKDATKKKIKVATLGSSDKLKVGSMAIAIGNALGYGQSVTVGYVSALDRAVTIDNSTRVLLQTDAAINPGNSGGALLDISGAVIGINSAKYSSTEVEGVCYAIPISKAIPIINDLMTKETLKDEEKGYLGITGSDVGETAHAYYNIPLGVLVASTEANGAAAKGGIKEKDIITAVNGIQVTSISALKERVNGFKYGTEVTLTVQRQENGGYKEMKIKVKLQKAPVTNQSNEVPQQNGSQGNGSQNGQDNRDDFYNYFGQDGSNGFPFSIN